MLNKNQLFLIRAGIPKSNARSSVSHEEFSENCWIETFSSGEKYNFSTSKAYSVFNSKIGDENDKSGFIFS